MKFFKQMYRHDPKNGIYGDCDRTVIACLLDFDHPTDVPHFFERISEESEQWEVDEAYERKKEWLRKRGKTIVQFSFTTDDLKTVVEAISFQNSGIPFALIGRASRGVGHVVLCENGRIIHDPHPDIDVIPADPSDIILGPEPVTEAYWVQFIV